MDQNNEKDEPSVDEILSSIKDVIANDKTSFDEDVDDDISDDNVFELTDIVDSDNVDTDEEKTNLEDSLSDANGLFFVLATNLSKSLSAISFRIHPADRIKKTPKRNTIRIL